MRESLQFFIFLIGAATIGGAFVYLLDCAFGDNLRVWFEVNPESGFILLAFLIGSIAGSFRTFAKRRKNHE